jgi:hypothetical protein
MHRSRPQCAHGALAIVRNFGIPTVVLSAMQN